MSHEDGVELFQFGDGGIVFEFDRIVFLDPLGLPLGASDALVPPLQAWQLPCLLQFRIRDAVRPAASWYVQNQTR